MKRAEAVTPAILKGRFEQIASETDATRFPLNFVPTMAEVQSIGKGKSGLPIVAWTVVIDNAAERDGLSEGNVWIFRDPYHGGRFTCRLYSGGVGYDATIYERVSMAVGELAFESAHVGQPGNTILVEPVNSGKVDRFFNPGISGE